MQLRNFPDAGKSTREHVRRPFAEERPRSDAGEGGQSYYRIEIRFSLDGRNEERPISDEIFDVEYSIALTRSTLSETCIQRNGILTCC